jgi:hypothetical protein
MGVSSYRAEAASDRADVEDLPSPANGNASVKYATSGALPVDVSAVINAVCRHLAINIITLIPFNTIVKRNRLISDFFSLFKLFIFFSFSLFKLFFYFRLQLQSLNHMRFEYIRK